MSDMLIDFGKTGKHGTQTKFHKGYGNEETPCYGKIFVEISHNFK